MAELLTVKKLSKNGILKEISFGVSATRSLAVRRQRTNNKIQLFG